ncbi:MAG: hypothetical protein HOV87_35810, partial [Catenulispora sp.]|nr:hypothetical protein [Catenulispora sp.]
VVAAFAAGGGGSAVGPGAGVHTPDPHRLGDYLPLPSPSVIAPQSDPDANATAPNPQDEVMVIAHGTIDGQRWRVVRDRYVIAAGDTSVSAWGGAGRDHFPMSEKTRAGVRVCEYLGVQWGDRPAGTVPDYRFSGTCADPAVKPGKQTVLVPFLSTNLPPSREGAVTVVIAKVDPSRVSSATVAVDGHISARQPVVTVIGSQNEGDRYSVFLVDPAYDEAGQPMLFTVYDDKGKTLESQPLAP